MKSKELHAILFCIFVNEEGRSCQHTVIEWVGKGENKIAYYKATAHAKAHGVKNTTECFDRMVFSQEHQREVTTQCMKDLMALNT